MTSSNLAKGQNISLPEAVAHVEVLISWVEADNELDASALLLDESGKVRSDSDFVFYNQPESTDGSVRYLGMSRIEEGAQARLTVDLADVPPDVRSIVLVGSSGGAEMAELGKLTLRVQDSACTVLGEFLTAADTERAYVFGELYRRGEIWKLRAIGQGWSSGLAGLATDYGVDVDDAAEDAVTEAHSAVQRPAEVNETSADAHSSTDTTPGPGKPSRPGVRTRKSRKTVSIPEPKLAGAPTWQPARLFSVSGVGSGDEQERRATSALLATMQAVRPFARAVCAKAGAPVGSFEGYLEVPYTRGEVTAIPDGVLRVARGSRIWTALLEVKTGTGKLNAQQLESYLDVARRHQYDVVLSLSNDIPAGAGELPVRVDSRKLKSVALRHISWAEVMHEARMLLSHGGVENPLEAWILAEFLKYLSHAKSGANEFTDMGRHWVAVRDAVAAGSLRSGDSKASSVADKWVSLGRHLGLRFTAELGVAVRPVLPRKLSNDAEARTRSVVEQLADGGRLETTLKIPDTAGNLTVVADLRTNKVLCSTNVDAPDEGSSIRRIGWLLRQLKDAPDHLLVEVAFSEPNQVSCEQLGVARTEPKVLTQGRSGDVQRFTLTLTAPMGSRRSGTAVSFIGSVTTAADAFYAAVLQPLRLWVPSAPAPISDDRDRTAAAV